MNEITDVKMILHEGSRSTESDIYEILIQDQNKLYYTNYLSYKEASDLNSKFDSLRGTGVLNKLQKILAK